MTGKSIIKQDIPNLKESSVGKKAIKNCSKQQFPYCR